MSRREALIERFRVIAGERVARVRASLAALADPDRNAHSNAHLNAHPDEDLRAVEHELHTLKGEARLLGFGALGDVARDLEKLLPLLGVAGDAGDVGESGQLMSSGLDLIDRLRGSEDPTPEASDFSERVLRHLEANDGA